MFTHASTLNSSRDSRSFKMYTKRNWSELLLEPLSGGTKNDMHTQETGKCQCHLYAYRYCYVVVLFQSKMYKKMCVTIFSFCCTYMCADIFTQHIYMSSTDFIVFVYPSYLYFSTTSLWRYEQRAAHASIFSCYYYFIIKYLLLFLCNISVMPGNFMMYVY